jgi:hypothetical protein
MLAVSKMTMRSNNLLFGLSNRAASLLGNRIQWSGSGLCFQNSLMVRGVKSKGFFYEIGVLFSKEKRAERAKRLQEEVNRGRFYELNELKATGGKLFESSEKLLVAASSKVFPSIDGVQLLGQPQNSVAILRGKVTLVTICLRQAHEFQAIVHGEVGTDQVLLWMQRDSTADGHFLDEAFHRKVWW